MLYFKSNLSYCQTKSGNNLESTIKEIVEENFSSQEVIFKTVAIADEANASLVAKYNAKSQTVVMVNTKKNKSLDVSDIVRQYLRDGDKTVFSKSFGRKGKNHHQTLKVLIVVFLCRFHQREEFQHKIF